MPLPKKTSDLIPKLGLIPHPEGGFFVETHRSGSMPMSSKGQTDFAVSDYSNGNQNLVVESNVLQKVIDDKNAKLRRGSNRPDGDERYFCFTLVIPPTFD